MAVVPLPSQLTTTPNSYTPNPKLIPMSFTSTLRTLARRLFRREEDQDLREVVRTLAGTPLFAGFPRGMLVPIAELAHRRTYRRDEVLYHEGDPGLGLYVVQRGRVVLEARDEEEAPHELRQAVDGDVFGELSLVGHYRRVETARALTETRVLGFFRPDLETLVRRHPAAGARLLAALARHLAERQQLLVRRLALDEDKISALRLLDGTAPQLPAAPARRAAP